MMYVVTSFDFGGTSNVKLHAVTDDEDLAQDVYASVLAACDESNRNTNHHPATMMMVELTRVPKNARLLGADALTLFWGGSDSTQNNNNNHNNNNQ